MVGRRVERVHFGLADERGRVVRWHGHPRNVDGESRFRCGCSELTAVNSCLCTNCLEMLRRLLRSRTRRAAISRRWHGWCANRFAPPALAGGSAEERTRGSVWRRGPVTKMTDDGVTSGASGPGRASAGRGGADGLIDYVLAGEALNGRMPRTGQHGDRSGSAEGAGPATESGGRARPPAPTPGDGNFADEDAIRSRGTPAPTPGSEGA